MCVFTLLAACTACDTPQTPSVQGGTNDPGIIDAEISDGNEVEVTEPDTAEHDYTLSSQEDGKFTYTCKDCGEELTVSITCESGTQSAYTVEGNTITFQQISEQSVYDIQGAFHGNIVIDVTDDYKFELQMSGFEMYSYNACPIAVLSGDKVTLSAKKSTVNYIYDMREAVDETDENAVSASVYALCDLDIQGKGSLFVTSVNNNGIHTKDDLNVKNLSLQVDCKDNALKGNDSVTVQAGSLILIARQGDGIKTTNSDVSSKGNQRGAVTISGGDILIYAACDGIDAAYDVVIDESTATVNLQIFTDKYSKYSEEVTATAENVYYVRYTSDLYKYSIRYFNDEDEVWYSSSSYSAVNAGRNKYYYYSVTKPSGYSNMQLFVYSSAQEQGQSENYVYCTDTFTMNSNYDTLALQKMGNSFFCEWTNYTTSSAGNTGGFGNMNGGNMGGFGDMNEGNTDKGDYSTKGMKAGNAIAISAGAVTISSYDDAVHANCDSTLENGSTPLGSVTITGGILTLSSNDDGIHGDGKVTISGGTIYVVNSYEGIEGNTVEISNGNVSVKSTDDGINGTATSGTAISVVGGNLYVYAGGDGLDSNSAASFSGGTSVIISTGQADSSIDTERGYQYSGGYVIGIGRSGGMGNESINCSNFSSVGTSKTLNLQKDAYLVVSDVATVKMPVAINSFVVLLGKTSANISSANSTSYDLDANGVYWNV